jgi:hypothetical protein
MLPHKRRNSDLPIGYLGRTALRTEQCDIFAESRGTLVGNGPTNTCLQQCNNRGIPGSGVFYTVGCQARSDTTMEHITHINKATVRRNCDLKFQQ